MYIYIYIHTHIHTYIYIYMYIIQEICTQPSAAPMPKGDTAAEQPVAREATSYDLIFYSNIPGNSVIYEVTVAKNLASQSISTLCRAAFADVWAGAVYRHPGVLDQCCHIADYRPCGHQDRTRVKRQRHRTGALVCASTHYYCAPFAGRQLQHARRRFWHIYLYFRYSYKHIYI